MFTKTLNLWLQNHKFMDFDFIFIAKCCFLSLLSCSNLNIAKLILM